MGFIKNIKDEAQIIKNYFSNTPVQNGVFAEMKETGAKGRAAINKALARVANYVGTEGEATVRAPIAKMENYSFTPVKITENMSDSAKVMNTVKNKLGSYHASITKNGAKASRIAGTKVYTVLTGALGAISTAFESAGLKAIGKALDIVFKSVAYAISMLVRGLTLAVSQLAHAAPYLAALAVAGGIVTGFVFLAKASVIAAVAVAFGLTTAIQQVQIIRLGQKIDALKTKMNESTLKSRILRNLPSKQTLKTAAKYALGAAVVAGLAIGGYKYGGSIVNAVKSYFAKPAVALPTNPVNYREQLTTASMKAQAYLAGTYVPVKGDGLENFVKTGMSPVRPGIALPSNGMSANTLNPFAPQSMVQPVAQNIAKAPVVSNITEAIAKNVTANASQPILYPAMVTPTIQARQFALVS